MTPPDASSGHARSGMSAHLGGTQYAGRPRSASSLAVATGAAAGHRSGHLAGCSDPGPFGINL